LDAEEVEGVNPDPNIFEIAEESAIHDSVLAAGKLVREADIHTAIGWGAQYERLPTLIGDSNRQPASKQTAQVKHRPLVARKIILKI